MNPAALLHTYGYAAIAAGTFCEGEFTMIAGGALAAAGLLHFSGAIAAGLGGVAASDLAYFMVGRYLGHRAGRFLPQLFAQLHRAFALMEDYQDKLAIYFQFFSCQSAITPAAFGMTRIPVLRFVGLDLIGAALWSVLFGLGGWGLGFVALRALHSLPLWLAAAAGAGVVAASLLRLIRAVRRPARNPLWSAPAAAPLSGTGTSF